MTLAGNLDNEQEYASINQELYKSFFHQSKDVMFLIDLTGRIINVNQAVTHMTGYEVTEFINKNRIQYRNEKALGIPTDVINKTAAGYRQHTIVTLNHRNGHTIHLRIDLNPFYFEGKIWGVCGIAKDITEKAFSEAEFKETKDQLESFITNTTDGIAILDLNGKITKINNAFMNMFGRQSAEVMGKNLVDITVPQHLVTEMTTLFSVVKFGGQVNGYETTRFRCDQTLIDVSITLSPIRDIQGNVTAIASTTRDITDRKRVDQNLRDTLKELSDIKRALDESSILAITDAKGKIQYVNDKFCEISKYRAEELIGQDHRIINSGYHPKSFFMELWQTISRGEIWHGEIKNKAKDNSYYWVMTTIVPFVNDEGKPYQYVVIRTDITQRKQIEDDLRVLIDAIPDLVIFKDGDGRWLDANRNAVEVFQLEGTSFQGKTDLELSELIPLFKDTLLGSQQSDEVAWKSGTMIQVQETLPSLDGTSRIFDIMKVPLYHTRNQKKGLLVLARDITERKSMEDLLIKSEKLSVIGELAAGIAHEVRNPLASLKGFVQLLQSGVVKKEYFELILSETERINSITGELLLLAKPRPSDYKQIEINSIVERVCHLFAAESNKTNIQLITSMDSNALVHCDETKLKQVFINIVKNSMEAMPEGGEITICSELSNEQEIIISINDQGFGMSEEQLRKIGQPFFTSKEKGTGLGMMVTLKIIEDHRGKIKFSSKLGKGTKVEVVLPIIS